MRCAATQELDLEPESCGPCSVPNFSCFRLESADQGMELNRRFYIHIEHQTQRPVHRKLDRFAE